MEELRLKALDDDDLEVFATILQDASMPMSEVTYLKDDARFAALFRRYCYERSDGPMTGTGLQQVDCVLILDHVREAVAGDLGGLGGTGTTELMTIVSEEHPKGGLSIVLVFSCGGHIRLDAARIEGRLADIGKPSPADRPPRYVSEGDG